MVYCEKFSKFSILFVCFLYKIQHLKFLLNFYLRRPDLFNISEGKQTISSFTSELICQLTTATGKLVENKRKMCTQFGQGQHTHKESQFVEFNSYLFIYLFNLLFLLYFGMVNGFNLKYQMRFYDKRTKERTSKHFTLIIIT